MTKTTQRLLIGPVNSAGQAFAWARAAERLPGVAAVNFMYRGAEEAFGFPADHAVSTAYFVQNRRWQRAQRRAVERGFTHVLFESGRRLFGTEDSVSDEAQRLIGRGLRAGLVFHGSDIRLPSVHADRESESPFRDGSYTDQQRLEAIAVENLRLLESAGLPVFVSTPDLLAYAPQSTWLPVVVDASVWAHAASQDPMERSRPIVVHAPSRARLKGTALVRDAARRLDAEGLIEYREISGVAAGDMPDVYGQADIVLDQFSLGSYGVAACEALSAGRIVVSHVAEDVRDLVQQQTGRILPIREATGADLERVLRELVADPPGARALAEQGPAFVKAVHSGARSAETLAAFLGVRTGEAGDRS
ncbi:glycosyltransferase [Microbacterium aerolatum]|uniref:glycosyltransferase family protein n=1 Tax=Microbacterium aerolatum TaxID=153731 RepID=UPI0038513A64